MEALVYRPYLGSDGNVIGTQRLASTRTPFPYPLDKLMRPERWQRLPCCRHLRNQLIGKLHAELGVGHAAGHMHQDRGEEQQVQP